MGSGDGALAGQGAGGATASMPSNVAAANDLAAQAVKKGLLNSYEQGVQVSARVSPWILAGTSVTAVMLVVSVVGLKKWRSQSSLEPLEIVDEESLMNDVANE